MLNKVKWPSIIGAILAVITAATGVVVPPGLEAAIVALVMFAVGYFTKESRMRIDKLSKLK